MASVPCILEPGHKIQEVTVHLYQLDKRELDGSLSTVVYSKEGHWIGYIERAELKQFLVLHLKVASVFWLLVLVKELFTIIITSNLWDIDDPRAHSHCKELYTCFSIFKRWSMAKAMKKENAVLLGRPSQIFHFGRDIYIYIYILYTRRRGIVYIYIYIYIYIVY